MIAIFENNSFYNITFMILKLFIIVILHYKEHTTTFPFTVLFDFKNQYRTTLFSFSTFGAIKAMPLKTSYL